MWFKEGSNVLFGNVWIEIPNENVVHKNNSFVEAAATEALRVTER